MQHYWLAGNRHVDETKFAWYLVDQTDMDYQSWKAGEPNNSLTGGEEKCVEFYYATSRYGWNDENYDAIMSFICEQS